MREQPRLFFFSSNPLALYFDIDLVFNNFETTILLFRFIYFFSWTITKVICSYIYYRYKKKRIKSEHHPILSKATSYTV
jgi:hypothetical protein